MPLTSSNDQSPHLILPALRPQHRVRQVGSPGVWEDGRIEDLTTLATGLDRGEAEARVYDVLSIPDVWAQAEVFRMALSDPASDLYAQSRAEWRGLLALFALKDAYPYQLAVADIRLNENDAADAGVRALPRPLRALSRVAPKVSINGTTTPWRRVGLIQINGQAAGLLIPSTLVCPSRTPVNATVERGVPWCRKGRMCDPVGVGSTLNDNELLSLHKFLSEAILQTDGGNDEIVAMLVRELTAFRDDCRSLLLARQRQMENIPFRSFALGLALPGPEYRCLQTLWRLDIPPPPVQDTMIQIRSQITDERGEHSDQSIILVDPRIAAISGVSAGAISLCAGITLERYLTNPEAADQVRQIVRDAGHILATPAHFFADRLCILGQGEIGSHGPALNRLLLPVTPLALLAMSTDELMAAIEVTKQPDKGGYLVTLQLRLHSNRRPGTIPHVIERFYPDADVFYSEVPSALSLWPNFQCRAWNRYFVFYGGAPRLHFTIRALLSPASLATTLDGGIDAFTGQDKAEVLRHCRGNDGRTVALAKDLTFDTGGAQGAIFRSEQAPEAVFCEVPDAGRPDAAGRCSAGLLVLPQGKIVDTGGPRETWSAGIDFGTTKTTVYIRKGRQNPEPVTFANRILSPFPISDTSLRSHWDFIPQRAAQVPFITALRARRQEAWAMPAAIWSCFIYYIDNMEKVVGDLKSDQSRSTLQLNLKWAAQDRGGEDRRARQYVQLFLEQVVLQTAAEACAAGIPPTSIHWSFSYPEAFGHHQYTHFQTACGQAVGNAVAGTQIPPSFQPESLSSALFFDRKMNVRLADPVVTIDIGGRTADISIWQDNSLLWRNSVELAGQHILIDLLVTHTDLLLEMLSMGAADGGAQQRFGRAFADLATVNDTEAKAFSVEVLMGNTEFGRTFTKHLHLLAGQPKVMMLTGIANLSLAGLLFYIAQTLRWLKTEGAFKPLQTNQRVTVCLGGRVADLFRSILPPENGDSPIIKFFKAAGTDLFSQAKIVFSDSPKHEVAFGLLSDDAAAKMDERKLGVISGEEVSVAGKPLPAGTTLGTLGFTNNWRVDEPKALKDMLRLAARTMGLKINWTAHLESEIVGTVNGQISDALRKAREEVENDELNIGLDLVTAESTLVEPPFILALRNLIRRIVREETQLRVL